MKNEAANKKNDVPPITWALPFPDHTFDYYTEVWHRSSVVAKIIEDLMKKKKYPIFPLSREKGSNMKSRRQKKERSYLGHSIPVLLHIYAGLWHSSRLPSKKGGDKKK